jgi:DNA polymerase/3'-5' exonuclease PolX
MKIKMMLSQAEKLTEKIKAALAPGCERIQEAGSVRRHRPLVGDIEIVAIPKLIPELPAQLSILGDLLEKLVKQKPLFRRGDKNGTLFKNFLIEYDDDGSEIGLDLFLTTPEQWGYILALRTGPGAFNQAWVTKRRKGGLLPDEYSFSGGWLHKAGQRIPTPEEEDIFRLIGDGAMLPPGERDNWRRYLKNEQEALKDG